LGGPEIGPELDQNRPQLWSELPNPIEKLAGEIVDVAKPALVGDLLRQLGGEKEVVRRALRPSADGLRDGDSVERRIHFDGVEPPRIDCQVVGLTRALRIEGPDPGVVVPSLRAYSNRRRHKWNRHARLGDVKSSSAVGGLFLARPERHPTRSTYARQSTVEAFRRF